METVSLSSFNSIYFTSDMPDVAVSVPSGAVKSHVVMSCNGETFFDEMLWPSDGIITLRELGELMEPLAQSHLVVSLTIQAQGMTEEDTETGALESSTSTVLFSRADVGTSAAEFYTSHFLSILQGDKVTSHGRLEYLWYYGQDDATVTAEYDDGTTGFFAALKSGGTSAYTQLDGAKYKIWRTRRTGEKADVPAGSIVRADKKTGLFVAAGDEVLEIVELQAPGKKKMRAADYLNGHGFADGARFA